MAVARKDDGLKFVSSCDLDHTVLPGSVYALDKRNSGRRNAEEEGLATYTWPRPGAAGVGPWIKLSANSESKPIRTTGRVQTSLRGSLKGT
jgi:hypothetical protein